MVHHWPAASVNTVLWPTPIQRLPFWLSTGVPPARPLRHVVAERSRKGPSGLRARPV
jgi:hypothetical protein